MQGNKINENLTCGVVLLQQKIIVFLTIQIRLSSFKKYIPFYLEFYPIP